MPKDTLNKIKNNLQDKITLCQPTGNCTEQCSTQSKVKTIADLKSEIMEQIPNAINADTCTKECLCQLNQSLLEYFIQIELKQTGNEGDSKSNKKVGVEMSIQTDFDVNAGEGAIKVGG